MTTTEGICERLLAYISPRRPETEAQEAALLQAVEAQEAYEAASGLGGVPGSVRSFSIGDFSASLSDTARGPAYTMETISPVAWSVLYNAGLIAYTLPTARRR